MFIYSGFYLKCNVKTQVEPNGSVFGPSQVLTSSASLNQVVFSTANWSLFICES